jgi:1-deoxy-D-xylulose-5-phosphate reductoisomerase
MNTARRLTILGSTGSIGRSTLDVVAQARAMDPDAFPIAALVGGRKVAELAEQARRFRPQMAVIADPALLEDLRAALADTNIGVAAGQQAVVEAAAMPADWVMAAIVGAAGLAPTLEAARRGAAIAVANKECLVCAGALFVEVARAAGATLLPVDSEHNAIFQVLGHPDRVEKLILTASGGPFRTATLEQMAAATPEQAVAHPNWSMGAKISIDSATMMNKGLELIEAALLFSMPSSKLEVVVHPQSIIHSLVSYCDGSTLAQLGAPDMRVPIASALAWPDRMAIQTPRLDLAAVHSLTFEAPDLVRFPALRLARTALEEGQGAPTALNAANEAAVGAFLDRRVGFLDIAGVVEETLALLSGEGAFASAAAPRTLEDVAVLDGRARNLAASLVARRAAAA